jgi:ATP-dependent Clp protease ATP-binding subunit ClpC
LAIAKGEADRLSHNYIGTEHLLLGIIKEESGIAGRVLRELNAKPKHVAEMVERMTGAGKRVPSGKLDLTPRTKQVIEYGVEEARKLGHSYIGSEHLLLGLIRQGDGVAIDVLRQLGLTPDRIRREVLRAVQQEVAQPEEARAGVGVEQDDAPLQPSTGTENRLNRVLDAINEVLNSGDLARIYQLGQYAEFLQWRSRRGHESQ